MRRELIEVSILCIAGKLQNLVDENRAVKMGRSKPPGRCGVQLKGNLQPIYLGNCR
jgi:hypothetical protein